MPDAPRPNDAPQSSMGEGRTAPTTFSTTYGNPMALSRSEGRVEEPAGAVRPRTVLEHRMVLAWRARMDCVERAPDVGIQRVEGVHLDEVERVVGLWLDVHAHNLEPSPRVAHPRTASTAEQIEEPRFHGLPPCTGRETPSAFDLVGDASGVEPVTGAGDIRVPRRDRGEVPEVDLRQSDTPSPSAAGGIESVGRAARFTLDDGLG